jgi:hypothetical protein
VSKKQFLKVTGFIGTLAAGTALVASAATGTGAWFTSTTDGTLTAQSGHLKLSTSATAFDYRNIMPGTDKTLPIDYTVDVSDGGVDVWLTFDTSTQAYSAFTGYSAAYETVDGVKTKVKDGQNGYDDGGLGRYGHFKVSLNSTPRFDSYNLQNAPDGTSGCADDNGWGYAAPAKSPTDTSMGYCGVPGRILIASNLTDGATGTINLAFGLTGKQTVQNQLDLNHLPFQIVATQHGHLPGDADF